MTARIGQERRLGLSPFGGLPLGSLAGIALMVAGCLAAVSLTHYWEPIIKAEKALRDPSIRAIVPLGTDRLVLADPGLPASPYRFSPLDKSRSYLFWYEAIDPIAGKIDYVLGPDGRLCSTEGGSYLSELYWDPGAAYWFIRNLRFTPMPDGSTRRSVETIPF